MAYELSYLGAVEHSGRVVHGRELLHVEVCRRAHPSGLSGTSGRRAISAFREELEKKFSELVSVENQRFEVDTILLDVPEPDKDQIIGLFVDRRSKRLRRTRPLPEGIQSDGDFLDLRAVSPIAASLSDVFKLWARKVRIYMTEADLDTLKKLGFSTGDIAGTWERVLFDVVGNGPGAVTIGSPRS
jgi:hypothetical protein